MRPQIAESPATRPLSLGAEVLVLISLILVFSLKCRSGCSTAGLGVLSASFGVFSGGFAGKQNSRKGQKLNTIFFLNRAPPGYPSKIPGYPDKKSLISLVSRDAPNFLAPIPSSGRPLPKRNISGLKSLGLGSFFVPDLGKALLLSGQVIRTPRFRSFERIDSRESIHEGETHPQKHLPKKHPPK